MPPRSQPTKTIPDPETPCSYAIIDGVLCRVNRKGRAVVRHAPVGSAIVQFFPTATGELVVRELGHGFLPGFSNLYCVDAQLRMLWFAELPAVADYYAGPVWEEAGTLRCVTLSGVACRLEPKSGRILAQAMAAEATAAAAE